MDSKWVNDTWAKVETKMQAVRERTCEKIPYTTIDGVYDDWKERRVTKWTNGFWAGIMWLMYIDTNDERYRAIAEDNEKWLDGALEKSDMLVHDLGFMWLPSAGVNYRLFGTERSRERIITAASLLAARYNIRGEFIRAWNGEDRKGYVIIDCMMNLPLLYLASEITDDPRFKFIAMAHADTALKNHIRPDGSVYHILRYDQETGDFIGVPNKTQGFEAQNSSWSRGQAWAIYGYVLEYIHSGKKEYLDCAKRVAHYFLANVSQTGYISLCDFRAPCEPVIYDTSAAACAACGLIEIASAVGEYEKALYLDGAERILKALCDKMCDWDVNTDAILRGGAEDYHGSGHDMAIIYGDYYFIEALYKLRGNKPLFW